MAVADRESKAVWRWMDAKQNALPVVGSWVRVGCRADEQVLVESTSLLPSLMLKREKQRRRSAEKTAQEALDSNSKLREDLSFTKRTDGNMRDELTSMLCEMSEFSKMLTENPSVLTWRVNVRTGAVDFVSPASCERILGFTDAELLGKPHADTLHPDERGEPGGGESGAGGAQAGGKECRDLSHAVRLRRVSKSGEAVWLESRAYAWWDPEQTVLIVTEYDITQLWRPA